MEAADGMTPPPPPGWSARRCELMTRAEATWLVLLPLNRLLASTPFSRKLLRRVALAVGPDGRVAQTGVGAGAAGQFGVDAGAMSGQAGKAAGGQRDGFNLRLVEHVAYVVSTAFISGEASTSTVVVVWPTLSAAFTVTVRSACTTMCCVFCTSNPVGGVGQRVGADGQVAQTCRCPEPLVCRGARQRGLLVEQRYLGVGNHASRGVCHLTGDAAKCLLCQRVDEQHSAMAAATPAAWEAERE